MGTAYAASSRVWFTFWNGIVTEVYYPTVDRPQLRDLQYLITDGKSFFHDEKRNLKSKLEHLSDHGLGYRCTNSDPAGHYAIVKEIITDPHLACVLQHTKLTGDESFLSKLRLYALCAPHLEVGGWGNNGYVARVAGRTVLIAEQKGNMAGAGGHGSFFPCFVRLRWEKRRLDRPARQFSNGLGVRSRPRRQHRAHRENWT